MNKNKPKGFTLIELLVVIAILATLAVAVTLILNPAELVRQGRDSTRLSDLSALQSAVSLYLADQAEVNWNDTVNCTDSSGTFSSPPTLNVGSCSIATSTVVSGGGWIDLNFTQISSGAPLSNLPLDPVNENDHYYVWAKNSNEEYEINANMESERYSTGDDDVESTDGGNDDNWYEIGNSPQLSI